MKKIKEINPLDLVKDQYQNLKEKLRSARDDKEKKVIFRRLVNLLGVMRFLISINKGGGCCRGRIDGGIMPRGSRRV
jgi:hypothetical protein